MNLKNHWPPCYFVVNTYCIFAGIFRFNSNSKKLIPNFDYCFCLFLLVCLFFWFVCWTPVVSENAWNTEANQNTQRFLGSSIRGKITVYLSEILSSLFETLYIIWNTSWKCFSGCILMCIKSKSSTSCSSAIYFCKS